MTAYVGNFQGWPKAEPKWKHEAEYQQQHFEMLNHLSETAKELAETDVDALDWLMHKVNGVMAEAYQIAKAKHDEDK